MSLFNTPDISGGIQDFWAYMRADRPHRWPALGLAITVAALVFYFILRSVNPAEEPKRTIIYVQSWLADRSDFDVRRDWLNRAIVANDRNERRRNNYGALARAIGQDYDQNAAHREFEDARATIRQAQRDLEAAQAAGLPLPPLPRREPEAENAPHREPDAEAPDTPAATPARPISAQQ